MEGAPPLFCSALAFPLLRKDYTARALNGMSAAGCAGNPRICVAWVDLPPGATRALAWLEAALHDRNSYLEYLKTSFFLDPLRGDPRFEPCCGG
jgi:hypothetical protein